MIFNINLDKDYRERKKSLILSILIPGLGQIVSGRWHGLIFILVNIFLSAFILYLHKPEILKNGLVITGFTMFYIYNLLDAFLGPYRKDAPCTKACPAGIDIPSFLALIADRRFEEAKGIILRKMPFISVCGTICPAYCESKCVRSGYDSSVMIMRLKKSTDDYKTSLSRKKMPLTEGRAAIIGAGPGGLSAAFFLSKAGIQSTVFEKESEPGGLLRFGIPEYRMDMLDLLKDTEAILSDSNIKLVTGTEVGNNYPIANLLEDYKYVIIATGSQKPVNPFRETVKSGRVKSALAVLKSISKNEYIKPGNDIVIVGGGNAAFDAARSILRMGTKPVIIYRKGEYDMPASREELEQALEEGIEVIFNTVIESVEDGEKLRINARNGDLLSVFTADCIIYAAGQVQDLSVFDLNIVSKKGFSTNYPNLFILPDGGSVVNTVANAGRVSELIIRKMAGINGMIYNIHSKLKYNVKLRDIPDAAWNYRKPRKNKRINLVDLEIDKRRGTFFKIERDLTPDEAVSQAKRCLGCHKKNGLSFEAELKNSSKLPDEGKL